ncbi:MAG: hypothetical protein GF310_11335 [candidate division Zixibacteria bacterium]|nr:hypothetical protein [candidate division Zixibacteria bacterium]
MKLRIWFVSILILSMNIKAFDLPEGIKHELGSYDPHQRVELISDESGNLHLFFKGDYRTYDRFGQIVGAGTDFRYSVYSPPNYERTYHYDDFEAGFLSGLGMAVSPKGYAYCTYGHDQWKISTFHSKRLLFEEELGFNPDVYYSCVLPDNSYIIPSSGKSLGSILCKENSFMKFNPSGIIQCIGSEERFYDQLGETPFGIWNPRSIALDDKTILYFGNSASRHKDSIHIFDNTGYYRVGLIIYDLEKELVVNFRDYDLYNTPNLVKFDNYFYYPHAIVNESGEIIILSKYKDKDGNISSCFLAIDRELNLIESDAIVFKEAEQDFPLNDKSIDGQFFVYKYERWENNTVGKFLRYFCIQDTIFWSESEPIVCDICKEHKKQQEKFREVIKKQE